MAIVIKKSGDNTINVVPTNLCCMRIKDCRIFHYMPNQIKFGYFLGTFLEKYDVLKFSLQAILFNEKAFLDVSKKGFAYG